MAGCTNFRPAAEVACREQSVQGLRAPVCAHPRGEDLAGGHRVRRRHLGLAGHRSWKDKDGSQTVIDFTRIGHRPEPAAKEMASQLNSQTSLPSGSA